MKGREVKEGRRGKNEEWKMRDQTREGGKAGGREAADGDEGGRSDADNGEREKTGEKKQDKNATNDK